MEGNITSEPDITCIKVTDDCDFIILGSDGIFDQLSNNDVVECAWLSTKQKEEDVHSQTARAVDMIMKTALLRRSIDNITCIILSFKSFGN